MTASNYNEMFLYWKLKELEELRYSGTLLFIEDQTVKGCLFLNGGHLSWGEATGQQMSLFSAMQSFAQVDRDDILFAETMYRSKEQGQTIVEVLENSGLVSFWTLRECMRAHLYAAVEKIGATPSVRLIEDDTKVVQASQHVFTIDELEYAHPYLAGLPHAPFNTDTFTIVEVRLRDHGVVLRFPSEGAEDKVAGEISLAHRACLTHFEDYVPTVLCYRYPGITYMSLELRDFYGTTIILGTQDGASLDSLASFLEKTPTALVMHIAESTIPLKKINSVY